MEIQKSNKRCRVVQKTRGVIVADVLKVFRGARVISQSPKKPPAEKPQRQLKLIEGGKR